MIKEHNFLLLWRWQIERNWEGMWASLEKSRDAGIQHEQQEHLDEEGKGTGASLLVTRRKRSRSFHTTGAKRAHGWGGERNSLQTRICTPKTDNKLELKHIYHNAYSKNTIFLSRKGVKSRWEWAWSAACTREPWSGAELIWLHWKVDS